MKIINPEILVKKPTLITIKCNACDAGCQKACFCSHCISR